MATRKKAHQIAGPPTPEPVSPYQQKLEETVDRLRAQVLALTGERDELRAQAAVRRRLDKPFVTRKYNVNGFTVQITGKDCMESDLRVDAVGDSVLIYTGAAVTSSQPMPSFAGHVGPAYPTQQAKSESWSNMDGGLPVGIGPSPQVSPEMKAKALESGNVLEFLNTAENSIINSKGRVVPGI